MLGNSWVSAQLAAFQEELSSMDLELQYSCNFFYYKVVEIRYNFLAKPKVFNLLYIYNVDCYSSER
jgi:hypothetical protein